MSYLRETDPEVFAAIQKELDRQEFGLELIASENYVSRAVLEAVGSIMTNKYAEGYPGKRYYGGCEFVDIAEDLARDRCKQLFGCDHANVQPHSGSSANMAAYFSILKPGDTILSMSLSQGGHLTHGHAINFSGQLYKIVSYPVSRDTETIDYAEMHRLAAEHKPKLILCGASAYSRKIEFAEFRKAADANGALLMADIAHVAGLVAAKLHPDPIPYCDFVTTTTHKTLRGPRGGVVMCKEALAQALDKTVIPGLQGGPLMHVIAGKAVAFKEALSEEFRADQRQTILSAAALAKALQDLGYRIVSGGTDNHLMLVDLSAKGVTGRDAEVALGKAGITVNRNLIPYDQAKPLVTSGIRLGTPAVTTRGLKESEMGQIASWIDEALKVREDDGALGRIHGAVRVFCKKFPVYGKMP